MKHLPRIAAQLYCQPLGILPSAHATLCQHFRAHVARGGADEVKGRTEIPAERLHQPDNVADDPVGPGWRDDDSGQSGYWHSQVQVLGSLAILPVHGVIGKHLSTLAMWCGGVDAALIARQARNIAADPAIKTVILSVNSPGGSCVGAYETAIALLGMSLAGKRTIAYTDQCAASNGYFWMSACDEIWAAPSSIVGSISTFCAYLDSSKAFEMEGLEALVFRSGNVKGAGQVEGQHWSPEEKAAQQLVVDQFSDQFKGFVKARRGLDDELMQGQYWPAGAAPTGIVDGLADDLDALLALLL